MLLAEILFVQRLDPIKHGVLLRCFLVRLHLGFLSEGLSQVQIALGKRHTTGDSNTKDHEERRLAVSECGHADKDASQRAVPAILDGFDSGFPQMAIHDGQTRLSFRFLHFLKFIRLIICKT